MKLLILAGILILIFGIFIGMKVNNAGITGKAVELGEYSYTKAICNAKNECIDVLVNCENGEAVKIEPISELKKFDEDWEDFREEEGFCQV